MALEVEGIVDRGMHAQKTLRRRRGFEALHLALASAHHLMRILRSIVLSQALLMVAGKSEMPEGSAVRPQLVGRHLFRRHCQLNELSPPSSSLSPDFRAGQQARLAFSDPEPRATDSRSVPRRLKLTMPIDVNPAAKPHPWRKRSRRPSRV